MEESKKQRVMDATLEAVKELNIITAAVVSERLPSMQRSSVVQIIRYKHREWGLKNYSRSIKAIYGRDPEKTSPIHSREIVIGTLFPLIPLDIRGMDEKNLTLSLGVKSDDCEKPSIYIFNKGNVQSVLKKIPKNTSTGYMESLGNYYGRQICPIYFLNSIPAHLKDIRDVRGGYFATYDVEIIPFQCLEKR